MGEAKSRKARDPYYGKVPKAGRGIVISPPLEVDGDGGIHLKSSELDPQELRRNLLFWDRLVWPDNRYISIHGSKPEVDFLESCGILERPIIEGPGGLAGNILADLQLKAFADREKLEPGQWSISEGESSFLIKNAGFEMGRALSVDLFRAIPIPDKEVPLEEVLEFKERRLQEIRHLILAIDNLYIQATSANDSIHAIQSAILEIDLRCSDAIKVAREARFPFRCVSLKLGFTVNAGSIAAAPMFAKAGWETLKPFGLEAVGSIVGGAIPFLGLSPDIGRPEASVTNSPYRVVAMMHEEL